MEEDSKVGDQPLAELAGLQFGLLSNEDTGDRERAGLQKFKFEDAGRHEQPQDVEVDMVKYFQEDLHRHLLSPEFKKQIDGLELLQKVIDFLFDFVDALRNHEYSLTDYEASILIPCLVEKSGHNNEKVCEKIRELTRLLCYIYPPSKVFAYVVEGLQSKNNRTRVECVYAIGYMVEEYGIEACEMDKRREGRPGEGRSDMRVIDSRSDESRSSLRRSAMDTGFGASNGYGEAVMEVPVMEVPHASLQQSSPLDWNEALDIVNNATSSEQVVDGLKLVCHELANAAGGIQILVTTTFNLGLAGASSRSCKYVLNTLMQTFEMKKLARGVKEGTLHNLITELLLWLLDERVLVMDDGSQLLKAMDVLMLKILENADWTSSFIVLIYLLKPGLAKHGAVNVRNQKFLDLVAKCLIKLTKLEIVLFNADDKDYEGYKFSITAKMSELWIVFLNWFIQEVLAYGMGLIPPSSGEVLLKLKDRIEDLHLVVGVRGQTGEGIIQEVNGFSLVLRELLHDLWHQVPAADLSIKIEELKAALSDKEYQVITECAIRNMAETPNSPPLLFPSKEEATDKINKEKQIVEEESPPPRQLSSDSNVVTNGAHGWSTEETVPEISGSSANTAASLASKNIHTTVKIGIGIDLVQLSLFVGGSQDNTLASIQWAFWCVDNSIGSFFTHSGLDAAIKYKAYEIRHVINNYKPYTVHETEPATAVSRQLSGTTPNLDVLQQEGTPPQEVQRDESGVVVSQGLSSGRSYEKWHHLATLPWDALPANLQYLNLMEPIVCVASAMSL
ncbi:unnamed protein product [Sphagnum balticum]